MLLKFVVYPISLFLVIIIFFRMPEETTGLTSFALRNTILGSPSLARRNLNFFTWVGIFIYLNIAFQLNQRGF